MPSWGAFKDALKTAVRASSTREDSATRLWVERQSDQPGVHHVVARPVGNTACILQIDVAPQEANASTQVVRQIADSIGAPQ
jgi:hypothetical protein